MENNIFTYRNERELESYITDNPPKEFDFDIIGRQYYLGKGADGKRNIIDLFGINKNKNTCYIIEVKPEDIVPKYVKKLSRQIEVYKTHYKKVGIIIGAKINKPTIEFIKTYDNIKYVILEDVKIDKQKTGDEYKANKILDANELLEWGLHTKNTLEIAAIKDNNALISYGILLNCLYLKLRFENFYGLKILLNGFYSGEKADEFLGSHHVCCFKVVQYMQDKEILIQKQLKIDPVFLEHVIRNLKEIPHNSIRSKIILKPHDWKNVFK